MLKKNKYEKKLIRAINELNRNLQDDNIKKLSELVGNNKKLFFKNFISGIFRGFGISIGLTILSALIIYLLQKLIRLNIPVISEYIMDIVDIVEKNR